MKVTLALLTISFFTCSFLELAQGQSACLPFHQNPEACIAVSGCNYCIQNVFNDNRCNLPGNLLERGCRSVSIIDHINKNLTVAPGGTHPSLTIPVLPGNKINLMLTWDLGRHPLDLYYLMDFSGSMGDDKANLVRLAGNLVTALKNISSDSALGFGTFVDKPVSPLGNPPYGDYSYWNNMRITVDPTDFAQRVNAIPMRGGGDGPEAQGDGTYQAAACTEQVGWRPNARHLLLVATDADYHKVGDGARGGITTPFDGRCHLNSSGVYTEQLRMDYPSDDQLVQVIADKEITVIFAVTAGSQAPYQRLADKMETAVVGTLNSDSSNILQLILSEYDKISTRFQMVQTNVTRELNLKYFSKCNGDTEKETMLCERIRSDGTVTFRVEVDLLECPVGIGDWNQIVRLSPLGLPTYIDINLALICRL